MCSSANRRRRLTRKRVQRHRGRTDEVRRETARAADRKTLGRQNEVDVRRSQRLAITRAGYVLKLYQSFPRGTSAWSTTYAQVCKEDFLYTYSTQESQLLDKDVHYFSGIKIATQSNKTSADVSTQFLLYC